MSVQSGGKPLTKPRGVFYGYIIVFVSFLIIFVMHGVQASYGVFFSSLQSEFGWNRTVVSAAFSIEYFLEGFFANVAGRLTDKFGPRRVMAVYGLIMGVGYLFMSGLSSLWQLYLYFGGLCGLSNSSANVSLLSTTARWFIKRRALMSGLVKVGTGAGIFIMPLVMTWLIAGHGWRMSYVIAAIALIVIVPLAAQFLRRDPSQKGLEPLGANEPSLLDSFQTGEGFTTRQAVRTRQFWMASAIYFIAWFIAQTIQIHIVPDMRGLNFSPTSAALILSTVGGVSIIGRMVMGAVGDRLGSPRTCLICFAIFAVDLIWLQYAHLQLAGSFWAFLVFAIPHGFAHGGLFALVSPVIAELFGTKAHGSIFGVMLLFSMMGGSVGPLLAGIDYDISGSYRVVFTSLIGFALIGTVISWQLYRGRVVARPTAS